jgi:hypothetical protein
MTMTRSSLVSIYNEKGRLTRTLLYRVDLSTLVLSTLAIRAVTSTIIVEWSLYKRPRGVFLLLDPPQIEAVETFSRVVALLKSVGCGFFRRAVLMAVARCGIAWRRGSQIRPQGQKMKCEWGDTNLFQLRPTDQLRDRETKMTRLLLEKANLILLETGRLSSCGTEYENHHPKHHRPSLVHQIQKQEELKKISEQTPVPLNLASYKTAWVLVIPTR